MRIAVSGTHRTGKTTLVEGLHEALPDHEIVDEPYWLLAEEGHEVPRMPSLADFELQLERAIEVIVESGADTIFDRCPADILAYLRTHRDADSFEIEPWLSRIQGSVALLDVIAYVPAEELDGIVSADAEDADFRDRVDEELRRIVFDDELGFNVDVLEVTGMPNERVNKVVAYMNRQKSQRSI